MELIKANNYKNYFSESGDVTLKFNLFDWLENERKNGWDSELFTGLAQYAVEFIVREAKGSYYSGNFNTDNGTLARMVLDEARKQGELSELADNHIKRLQGLLDKNEENERRHEQAMHEITARLYEIGADWVQELRSQIISKYYTDTPFKDAHPTAAQSKEGK